VRFLLDTQAIIWFNLEEPRLSEFAFSHIADSENLIFVSPASYWEMAIKIAKGTLKIEVPYDEFWMVGMQKVGLEVLHIQVHHTSRLLEMPQHHKDPFDRLLVAQSLADSLPIISCDSKLDAYGIQRIWRRLSYNGSASTGVPTASS
jgi:PIN domain nuclease of toxin-antitoxin system